MDEQTLAQDIDGLPAELAVWHDGPTALSRLLAICIVHRLREEEDLFRAGVGPVTEPDDVDAHVEDPRRTEHRDRWRHAVSTIIDWHSRYGTGTSSLVPATGDRRPDDRRASRRARRARPRPVTPSDHEAAVRLACSWDELDAIRVGLRAGDMHILRRNPRHVWVHNRRRPDIEVLDIVLGNVTIAPPPDVPRRGSDVITAWFHQHSSRVRAVDSDQRQQVARHLINGLPPHLREQAWVDVERDLRRQGTTIAGTIDLGGLTLENARTCYAFLLSQLYLNELAAFHFAAPASLLWAIRRDNLTTALASRVGREQAEAFIHMCTFTAGRSPVSAPLTPDGDLLLIPSEIVSPIAFERTLLRAASANPGAGGALGNVLGLRARRWADRLRTIPDCQIAEGVRVLDATGRTLGDLDVVAWDPGRDTMAIFETKWPVDAATLAETAKVDATFDKGTTQLTRLRSAIEDCTARVAWPRTWKAPDPRTASWWVGSAQQLDSRSPVVAGSCIRTTSLRLVEHLLPATDLGDLITRLISFPMPRHGVEYDLAPRSVQAGRLTVHYDALALLGSPPVPPRERRIHNGWT